MSASQVFNRSTGPQISAPRQSWEFGSPIPTTSTTTTTLSGDGGGGGAGDGQSGEYAASFEDMLRSRLAMHEDALREQRKTINESHITWLSPKQVPHRGGHKRNGGAYAVNPYFPHEHEMAASLEEDIVPSPPTPLNTINVPTRQSSSSPKKISTTANTTSPTTPHAGKRGSNAGLLSERHASKSALLQVPGGGGNSGGGSKQGSRAVSPLSRLGRRASELSQHNHHTTQHHHNHVESFNRDSTSRRSDSASIINPKALQRRQVIEGELERQHSGRPIISPASQDLARKHRTQRGVSGLPIEESLLSRDEVARAGRMAKAQQLAREEVPGVPKINPMSALISTSGDSAVEVYERLYADSGSKAQHLEALTRELKRLVEANVDSTFSPAITPRAKNMLRKESHTAHGDLYEQAKKAQEYKQHQARQRESEAAKAARSRTPQVNPMSRLIASRLEESTQERLCRRPKRHSDPDMHQQPTTPRHRGGVVTSGGGRSQSAADDEVGAWRQMRGSASSPGQLISNRIQNLYQDHARRETRRMIAQGEKNNEMPDDCTFTPHITPFNGQSAGGASSMYINSDLSLADRMRVWDDRRKARIAHEAKEKEKEELNGCTFEPSINPPSTIIEPDEPHHGYAKFIARHDRARKEAEEVNAIKEGLMWRSNATGVATSTTPVRAKTQPQPAPVDKDVLQRAIEALNRAKNASRHHQPQQQAVPAATPSSHHADPYGVEDPYNH